MKYLAAAAVVLGACTAESHDIAFAIGYGDVPSMPAYIAYRDGTGPWQTPARSASGTYTLRITDTYEVIYVCATDDGTLDIEELRATADDGPSITGFPTVAIKSGGCTQPAGTDTPAPFHVTGKMMQPSQVAIDGNYLSTSSLHATFDALVSSGTYPLLVTDPVGPGKPATRAMRRMVDVTGDVDLGTLDLAGEALPTEPTTIQVHGSISPGSWFVYGPWGIELAVETNQSSSVAVPLLAASQRDPDDHYSVSWQSFKDGISQSYQNNLFEGAKSIDLITPPTVTFTDAPFTATWTPDGITRANLRSQLGGGTWTRNALATPGWLAATGTTTMAFADNPPDLPAMWATEPSGTDYSMLWLQRYDGTAYSDVQVQR